MSTVKFTNPSMTPTILTVRIRDDGPMIHANDSPAFRSVRLVLTDQQRSQIFCCEYEQISSCWLEPYETEV